MKQIFLDMDGVLADFDKRKAEVFGTLDVDDRVLWPYIRKNHPNWFRELDPMIDMPLLWQFCKPHKPIILTACSRTGAGEGALYRTVQNKIDWIHGHLGDDVPVIVCMRTHKKDYASADAILVDDHEDNVKQFSLHGGIGILHKSAAMSIVALESVL